MTEKTQSRVRQRLRPALRAAQALAAALVVSAGLLAASVPPPADPAPADPPPAEVTAPELSIAISDGTEAAASGDELSYTIDVENLGSSDVFDLTITQSVPEGLSFSSADNGGALEASTVSWSIELAAGQAASLGTTMTVGETPAELLRLATVACALPAPADPPIVCASDSDILPAGVAAEEASESAAEGSDDSTGWIVAAGVSGAAVIVVAVIVVLVVRRRRPGSPK
jgi:uncharacterized repeat protein (TIGR01451 family)